MKEWKFWIWRSVSGLIRGPRVIPLAEEKASQLPSTS